MPTRAILRQIESMGYTVTARYHAGGIELHADCPDGRHVARNAEGDGEEDLYRAACELARMVGIDLEDG